MMEFLNKPEVFHLLFLIFIVLFIFKKNSAHIHNNIQFPTTYNYYYDGEKDSIEDDDDE